MVVKATIGEGGTVTIPAELLAQLHLCEGTEVLIAEDGGALVISSTERDPDQAWFWTEEWQAGERAADADKAAGRVTGPMTGEEFTAALLARMKPE